MGQNLYDLFIGRNLQVYDNATDLRAHVLNAVAVETTRGWRIAKEKSSKKIDGCVALAMACVATVDHAFKSPAVATISADVAWQRGRRGLPASRGAVLDALDAGITTGALSWQFRNGGSR